MQQLQDVFSSTIDKAKQMSMWEKLTIQQKEGLVSKYLLEYFNRKQSRLKAAVINR
jgi:hypothetical protein